jgi:DNA polymerase III delta prime subunit
MNIDELKAFFETDEGKASIERMKSAMHKKLMFKKCWKNKFKKFLENKTDDELNLLFENFYKHAEKRRDILWKQGYDGESSLYTPLLDSFSKLGTKAKKSRYSMFTTSMYVWRDYQVESYCGQGCFHSLSKI